MSLKKDYAKLGFIAYWTGLHVPEVEKVLEYAVKYEDMQEKKKAKEPQEEPLNIEKITKALTKHVKNEQQLFGPMK